LKENDISDEKFYWAYGLG
jgi:sterol desaturase/sphingolipid hydroxylase (fatty acid hydroxylase superfamily)